MQFVFLVFVKDIEKDDTLVRQGLTVVADLLKAAVGLPTHFAVVVDQPVLSSSDIFFKFPPMGATHLPVGNIRRNENSVDNLFNACVPPRIVFPDLLQSGLKVFCGLINIDGHVFILKRPWASAFFDRRTSGPPPFF